MPDLADLPGNRDLLTAFINAVRDGELTFEVQLTVGLLDRRRGEIYTIYFSGGESIFSSHTAAAQCTTHLRMGL